MKPMLLKYCLTIVFKKKEREERERDEKMACQKSMTQKKERERKDGMLKKHDTTNKVRHDNEHAIICALA